MCNQIWATLYDYPSLKACDGLIRYVKECVRTAWGLINQVNTLWFRYRPELGIKKKRCLGLMTGIKSKDLYQVNNTLLGKNPLIQVNNQSHTSYKMIYF